MPANRLNQSLLKPFVVLAVPGMYLVYKYNQFKRQQQENSRRKTAEKELAHLNQKIDKLLIKLDDHEAETPLAEGEECVVCLCAKATMQTYPCGHRVVCRKCFVKTIRVAVTQRCLPLRCVVCRTRVLKLKQAPPLPRSKSPGATAKALFGVGKSSSSKGGLSKGGLSSKLSGKSTLVPVSRHPAALIPSPTGKPPAQIGAGGGRSPIIQQAKAAPVNKRSSSAGGGVGGGGGKGDASLSQQARLVHSVPSKDSHSKHAPLVLSTQRVNNKLAVPHPTYSSTAGGTKVRRRAHVTRQ